MANIYVRKSGSDSNDGSTPALAKLTIAGAISAMNSDDIIWVGAGIYREYSLNGGAKNVTIYGDKTGEHTGDAGEIIWSSLNEDDDTYTERMEAIRSNSDGASIDIQDITFQNFRLRYAGGLINKTNYGDITLKNIKLVNVFNTGGDNCIGLLNYVHTTAETTETIDIENIYCEQVRFEGNNVGVIRIRTSETSDNYLKINNIKIKSPIIYSGKVIEIAFNGTIIDRIENIEISSCCFDSTGTGDSCIYISSSTPKDVYNSVIFSHRGGRLLVSSPGSVAYNCSVISSESATTYYVITQSNCVNKANYCIPKIDDISRFSPLKGVGNTSFPTKDIKGNPRPAYGNGNACDIGAVESTSDIIQKESTIKDSGDYSVKIAPCNYFKKVFQIPVTASELRTVKVKIRIDGTWGSYKPRITLDGQGMTKSQAIMNIGTGSFTEGTVSGTPTTTGIALLTIEAHSASTDAVFYIDTITIE